MAKWIVPFPDSKITSPYGEMSDYRRRNGMQAHSGTDWGVKSGTLIPAITDGTVKLIQFSSVLGWVVVQTGWDNIKKRAKYIGYCHLNCSYHGPECKGPQQGCSTPLKSTKVGDKVTVGQKYLKSGNSGSASSGPHLHATLSNKLKGVFGVTSAKQDLHAFIKEQDVPEPAPKPKRRIGEPPNRTRTAYCPCCKKPL